MSLVEIMVAMSILVVILVLLTGIIWQLEKVTLTSRSQADIYEQARTMFDLIGQDLQAMQVNNQSNNAVYWGTSSVTGLPSNMKLEFITASGIGATAADSDRTLEVGYSLGSDSQVVRWYTSQSKGSKWDFFNAAPSTWAASSSWGDSTVVATGVKSLTIIPYSDPTTIFTTTAAGDSSAPSLFRVEFELYDPNAALTDTQVQNSQRKFTKNIFISRGQ